jgi:hypothetical protein
MDFDDRFIQSHISTEPTQANLIDVSKSLGLTVELTIDYLANRVATQFLADQLTFPDADGFINKLFGYGVRHDVASKFMWSIYLAFDAGEYNHHPDSEAPPWEEFTKPLLRKVLAENDPAAA